MKLTPKVKGRPWQTLDRCPEKPSESIRVHVDTYGNVQFCQGITLGNLWKKPLLKIVEGLDLDEHPIVGPLRRGGPRALAKERMVRPKKKYADACHMCYEIRCALRKKGKLKKILVPDQAYGVRAEDSS